MHVLGAKWCPGLLGTEGCELSASLLSLGGGEKQRHLCTACSMGKAFSFSQQCST